MTKQIIRSKIIRTPKTTEIIVFNRGIVKGGEPLNKSGIRTGGSEETRKANRLKTIRKSKSLLRRLMDANMGQYKEVDKFITLTFREDVFDVSVADKELKEFLGRLKYFTGKQYEYLGVREKQMKYDRGVIHYHMVFFDLPYIPHSKLLEIWNNGNDFMNKNNMSGVNIKGLMDKDEKGVSGFDTITTYMSKYFVKELETDDFLKGHKTIIKSHGLKKPDEELSEKHIEVDDCSYGISFIENRLTYYKL